MRRAALSLIEFARLLERELLRLFERPLRDVVRDLLVLGPAPFQQPVHVLPDGRPIPRRGLVFHLRRRDEALHHVLGLDDPALFFEALLLARVLDVRAEPARLAGLVVPAPRHRGFGGDVLHTLRQLPVRRVQAHRRFPGPHRQVVLLHLLQRLHQRDEVLLPRPLSLDAASSPRCAIHDAGSRTPSFRPISAALTQLVVSLGLLPPPAGSRGSGPRPRAPRTGSSCRG